MSTPSSAYSLAATAHTAAADSAALELRRALRSLSPTKRRDAITPRSRAWPGDDQPVVSPAWAAGRCYRTRGETLSGAMRKVSHAGALLTGNPDAQRRARDDHLPPPQTSISPSSPPSLLPLVPLQLGFGTPLSSSDNLACSHSLYNLTLATTSPPSLRRAHRTCASFLRSSPSSRPPLRFLLSSSSTTGRKPTQLRGRILSSSRRALSSADETRSVELPSFFLRARAAGGGAGRPQFPPPLPVTNADPLCACLFLGFRMCTRTLSRT